jgi:hypothetical protein
MPSKPLTFPHKQIRARVIADYVRAAGYHGVVVFTCGNAARTLREQGLEVTEVGPRGDLKTDKWWTMAEIHKAWPDLFDATSGHLAAPIMSDIAKAYRQHLGDLPGKRYLIPSGSGETILCLRIVYPFVDFEAGYDDDFPETTRHNDAPLNQFVDAGSAEHVSEQERQEHDRKLRTYGVANASMPPTARKGSVKLGIAILGIVAALSSLLTFLATR